MDLAISIIRSLDNADYKNDEAARLTALTEARALVKRLVRARKTAGDDDNQVTIRALADISNLTFFGDDPARVRALAEARALVKRLSKKWEAQGLSPVKEKSPVKSVRRKKAAYANSTNRDIASIPPEDGHTPIFDLPVELRLIIYHLVLDIEDRIFITSPTRPNPFRGAVAYVNHQVRSEAMSIFHRRSFVGTLYDSSSTCHSVLPWLGRSGKANCARIRRLELRLSDNLYRALSIWPFGLGIFQTQVPDPSSMAQALFDAGINCDRVFYTISQSTRGVTPNALGWVDNLEKELREVSGKACKLYDKEQIAQLTGIDPTAEQTS